MSAVWNGEKHLFKRTSAQAVKCEKQAKLVAPSDMSVLILGGKTAPVRNRLRG